MERQRPDSDGDSEANEKRAIPDHRGGSGATGGSITVRHEGFWNIPATGSAGEKLTPARKSRMSWARLDDNFYTHPKVRKAWRCRPALGLHVMTLSFCMHHGTEGHVPAEFVEDQLPNARERVAAVATLVQTGLWSENGDGWLVHDFLDYNPSNEDQEIRRASDRERKREQRSRS